MKLSVKKVERITDPGRYGDGRGLYLQVTPTGTKSWLYRYERRGKEHSLGLGSALDFTLDEARDRAREARRALADGRDPLAERRAARTAAALATARAMTFEQAAQSYYNQHETKWKNAKHSAQFLSTLRTYAYPVIGKLQVAAITTADVLRVIEPIWTTKTETAGRVRSRIENVLAWATVKGYRSGDNPARWSGHLNQALPKPSEVTTVESHKALPYASLPAFIAALRNREGVAVQALEFLILTAARTSEVTGATWSEIDLATATWTIPASRMKAKKEHRVALSAAAVALLERVPREDGNEHVFVGGRKGAPMSNMAMDAVRKRMKRDDFTVHGFRSTFRDWAGEETTFEREEIEFALAHTVRNKVEAAYRRGDALGKRRLLMEAWAGFCNGTRLQGKVVQMRAEQ